MMLKAPVVQDLGELMCHRNVLLESRDRAARALIRA